MFLLFTPPDHVNIYSSKNIYVLHQTFKLKWKKQLIQLYLFYLIVMSKQLVKSSAFLIERYMKDILNSLCGVFRFLPTMSWDVSGWYSVLYWCWKIHMKRYIDVWGGRDPFILSFLSCMCVRVALNWGDIDSENVGVTFSFVRKLVSIVSCSLGWVN